MTKSVAKIKSAVTTEKSLRTSKRQTFKPNIRLANAIVGAIAFLQKGGFEASLKTIRKCMRERARKSFSKSLTQIPLYLNRGLELGILKKVHGSYKIGDFQLRKRSKKRKPTEKTNKKVEVIKGPSQIKLDEGDKSAKSSVCAF